MCRMNLRVQVLYRAGQSKAGQGKASKARHRDRDSVFLSCVKSSIADGARDQKEASIESTMALPFPSAPADGPPRQGRGKKGKPSRAVGDTAHSIWMITDCKRCTVFAYTTTSFRVTRWPWTTTTGRLGAKMDVVLPPRQEMAIYPWINSVLVDACYAS